ncbi:MAG: hypothetical protein M3R52_09565, partial [Acidobacteriota bacterium]|nr:hypothetical protein [Acidobacteriota bacterium]
MRTLRRVGSRHKAVGTKTLHEFPRSLVQNTHTGENFSQNNPQRTVGQLFSAYCLLPSAYWFGVIFLFALLAICAPRISAQQLAVQGDTVYTMAGQPIRDGVVLIRDGKVEQVGTATEVKIPAGSKTVRAKVVTPGLIDARSVVGLSGFLNQPHDQMQLELSASVQPELRATDAYNARERLVEWLRSFGVTTVHTGHAPGALISGQTMIVKTYGDEVDDAVIVPSAMVAATLGTAGMGQAGK